MSTIEQARQALEATSAFLEREHADLPQGANGKWLSYAAFGLHEQIDAALSALEAEGGAAVKVKALEWVKHPVAEAWRADTAEAATLRAENEALRTQLATARANALPDEIEAAARGMYGSKWDAADDRERPGEKMKDVWRKYAADAIAGFLARRSLLHVKEGQ